MTDTQFVTDGRTEGAILICLPKFLRGIKMSRRKDTWTAKSADLDKTAHFKQPDLGLQCLLRKFCHNI